MKQITLSRLVAANLLLVTLVMLIMLPLGIRMADIASEREMQDCLSNLQNGIEELSGQVDSLGDILTQTSSLRVFTRLSIIRDSLHPSDYLYMKHSYELLTAIASSNHAVFDVFLTFDENDLVITRHHAFDSFAAFLRHYSFENVALDELFSTSKPPEARLLPAFSVASEYNTIIGNIGFCYRLPLRLASYAPLQAVAYVLFQEDYVRNALMSKPLAESGALELMDQHGNLLFRYTAPRFNEPLPQGDGDLMIVHDSRQLLYVRAALSADYANSILKEINPFIYACIFGALLIGITASIALAYRQSRPIRNLLQEMETQGLSVGMERNDFLKLKQSLLIAAREKRGYVERMLSSKRVLKAALLDQALYVSGLDDAQEDAFKDAWNGFPEQFVVGYGCLLEENAMRNKSLLPLVLLDQFKRTLPEGSIAHPLPGNAVALIIPLKGEWAAQLEKACQEWLATRNGAPFALAFSTPKTMVRQIHAAFEQARLRFTQRAPDERLIVSSEEHPSGGGWDGGFAEPQTLQRLLLSGAFGQAHALIQNYFLEPDMPDMGIAERYYALKQQLQYAAQWLMPGESLNLPKYEPNIPPQMFLMLLQEAAQNLCDLNEKKKRSHNTTLKEQLIDYVKAHYMDPNLTVTQIAQAHHISEKYLYAFFKEQLGVSPALYIQQLRLSYVAQSLLKTDTSVQEIAEHAGFFNLNTFYKAFKRVYGMTPTQYRDTRS